MNQTPKIPIGSLTLVVVGLATLAAGCLQDGILDEIDKLDRGHHDAGGAGTGGVIGHHDAGVDSTDGGTDGASDQHDGGSGGVGQVGDACGGFVANGKVCGPGLFCDGSFPQLACVLDVSGTCQVKPAICDTLYAPVCGCDNKTYSNDCVRSAAGISKSSDGACPVCPNAVLCNPGAHWDPVTCKCVGICVDTVLCVRGSHFDSVTCKCVPDCVDTVLCSVGAHFDMAACTCVPNCVDTVLCVQGSHFDSVTCKCVPN